MILTTHRLEQGDDPRPLAARLRSSVEPDARVISEARSIVESVRAGGDRAVAELSVKLDGVDVAERGIEVAPEAVRDALGAMPADERGALELAASRIREFASRSVDEDWTIRAGPGVTVGRVRRPISPVGLYVPGGRRPYPSTVLMTGVPARVAGVEQIVFCVPPGPDGDPPAVTLAACALVGACRVFRIGGAQAVAAMAYGTRTVPACRMIAGPGNAYVAAAKRLIGEDVTVDLDAGPSEIAVYSDDTADAELVACDLLAQVEHDPMALAVLVTGEAAVLDAVCRRIKMEREAEGSVSLVLCDGREACLGLLNALAPEHVELVSEDAALMLPSVRDAGAVFLGRDSAVAFGDYLAGPSHVLPTGGTAARRSGLGPADFTRAMNVIAYTAEGVDNDARAASLLASMEGLARHADSIRMRAELHGTEV